MLGFSFSSILLKPGQSKVALLFLPRHSHTPTQRCYNCLTISQIRNILLTIAVVNAELLLSKFERLKDTYWAIFPFAPSI